MENNEDLKVGAEEVVATVETPVEENAPEVVEVIHETADGEVITPEVNVDASDAEEVVA